MRARVLLAALLALPVVSLSAVAPEADAGVVLPLTVLVDGQLASGLVGIPASGTSDVLVALAHGFGGSAAGFRGTLQDLANRGYLGVAMDYRGPQGAWKVSAGADDTVAATRALLAAHPGVDRTILWGISMGGQVSGLAIMRAPGLFDYWVSSVGVSNWPEAWLDVPFARAAMEAEAGGTPLDKPGLYIERSPALNLTAFRESGLRRAYLLHGTGDPLVPLTHGQELAANLLAQGNAVTAYAITTQRGTRVCLVNVTGVCTNVPPEVGIVPAGHVGVGYNIVLAKAAGSPDPPAPFLEGVYDLTTNMFQPAA